MDETREPAYCPRCLEQPTVRVVIDGEEVELLCFECADILADETGLG